MRIVLTVLFPAGFRRGTWRSIARVVRRNDVVGRLEIEIRPMEHGMVCFAARFALAATAVRSVPRMDAVQTEVLLTHC